MTADEADDLAECLERHVSEGDLLDLCNDLSDVFGIDFTVDSTGHVYWEEW